MSETIRASVMIMVSAVLLAGSAAAGPTDAAKCEADKLKRAGKYAFCRMKAESKAVKEGEAPDYTKCDTKLGDKFSKAETKWGLDCPTSGDVGDVQTQVTGDTDDLTVVLAGGVLASCGDAAINGGEQCDGVDLGGATCDSLIANTSGTLGCTLDCQYEVSACTAAAPPTTACGNSVVELGEDCDVGDLNGGSCTTEGFAGGELSCGTGCAYDDSGCYATRFVDNADGTVTDNETGLAWEQKVAGTACASCVNDHYNWNNAMSVFLSGLNATTSGSICSAGLGGKCDWRLPTTVELQTIVDCSGGAPCVDPVFGATASDFYWSSSTDADFPDFAWVVNFNSGNAFNLFKTTFGQVRAVRGGS